MEGAHIREKVVEGAGGPVRRMLARRWMRHKTSQEVARMVFGTRSKDVLREQERVFTYGFAYKLTADGRRGDVSGRIPLLRHQKALLMSTTFFTQADYEHGLKEAMEMVVDSWGFRYPGIKHVEHEYFWAVPCVDAETRRRYLARSEELGRSFADGCGGKP